MTCFDRSGSVMNMELSRCTGPPRGVALGWLANRWLANQGCSKSLRSVGEIWAERVRETVLFHAALFTVFLLSPPGLGRFSSLLSTFFVSEFSRRGFPPPAAQRYRSGVLPPCHSPSIKAALPTEANSSRVLLDRPKSARRKNETVLLTYAKR